VKLTDFNADIFAYKWHDLPLIHSKIDEPYRYWVNLRGSLTQALRRRSDHFSVSVLEQEHIILSQPINGLSTRTGPLAYFSRKVLLMHGETPWVAAHTLVPETSIQNGLGQLTKLENKPLGELLFSTPGVSKDHLQVCKLPTGWGRRARYLLNHQPLLVSEFFLPDLINYEKQRNTPLHKIN